MNKLFEIHENIEKAEEEIKEILKKYNLELSMVYDEGAAVTLVYQDAEYLIEKEVF